MNVNDPVERVPKVMCRGCGRLIETTHTYCPHCGKRQDGGDAWYYNPVWILILAFLAIGPIALIFVWKSPKMGRATKAVMAIAILAYTAFGGYYTWKVGVAEWREMNEIRSVMRHMR